MAAEVMIQNIDNQRVMIHRRKQRKKQLERYYIVESWSCSAICH